MVYRQLLDHLTSERLLSPFQSGFRPGHTTQDVIVKVTDDWRRSIDEKKMVGAIFLDLKKAFDCVDHNVLFMKLPYFGISGLELDWCISYLSDRSQKVRLENSYSKWCDVTVGVPQGSILGLLLFSIIVYYVNDLPSIIKHSNCHLYADDNTIMYTEGDSMEDIEKIMQKDLNEIAQWMKTNRIMLNVQKTASPMFIRSPQNRVEDCSFLLSINGVQISGVDCTKYLGAYINHHLTWNDHISHLRHAISIKLRQLYRLMPIPGSVLALLYKQFILPLFDYCDVVWSGAPPTLLSTLDRLHDCGITLVNRNCPEGSTSWSTLVSSLHERRKFHVSVMSYRILTNLCPEYLRSHLVTGRSSGRNPHRVYVPAIRTNYGKNAFYFRSTSIWNKLDSRLYSKTVYWISKYYIK